MAFTSIPAFVPQPFADFVARLFGRDEPVRLPQLPVTTKPTSEANAKELLFALGLVRRRLMGHSDRMVCISLGHLRTAGKVSQDVCDQLCDDVTQAIDYRFSVGSWLVDKNPSLRNSWGSEEFNLAAREVRIKWIDATADSIQDYLLNLPQPE